MRASYVRTQLTLWLLVVCCNLSSSALAQNVVYKPIPPGFDFPADEATLLRFRDTDNVSEMRRHAWFVFAGLTQPAPSGEALWETWFPEADTFQAGPTPAGQRRFKRRFKPPRQLFDPKQAQPAAPGASLLSFVMFNKDAHDWIRSNNFYRQPQLDIINNGFPAGTPLADRKIKDFPREAISLKLVWWRIKKDTITPMPVWDFQPTQSDAMGNPNSKWKRIVGVDPTRRTIPPEETTSLSYPEGSSARTANVVSIHDFYHFVVTSDNVDSFIGVPENERPQTGDAVALVGMHFTTKEIPDWVWATLWWHDRPDNGPYAADRPAVVRNVWRNYLMDVAYSMDTPREYDGTPNSCYNPWLEAPLSNGMQSNCMTCHQRAMWEPIRFLPVTRGSLAPDDPIFENKTKVDFLWSIPLQSKP